MEKNEMKVVDLGFMPRLEMGPFTIAFCYPKDKTAYIVKGPKLKVFEYINKTSIPTFVHLIIYANHSLKTTSYKLFNCRINIVTTTSMNKRGKKYGRVLIGIVNKEKFYTDSSHRRGKDLLNVKRVPRCWIKELDPYIHGIME